MCQLLGMSSNRPAAITFSFTGFCERGGRTDEHGDGWGIAFYERSGCRVFIDDAPASHSPLAAFVRDYPIKSGIVLAHIRKATQGTVSLSNCHPFQREWLGQSWVFCHNGDLKNFHPDMQGGPFLPVGTTDSEKAFCWLLNQLRKHFAGRLRPPGWEEIAEQLSIHSAAIRQHGTFNFMLSNGEALFVHATTRLHWLKREHPFPKAHLVDCDMEVDLSAMNHDGDRLVIIATEPLTKAEPWVAMAPGEMHVFIGGESRWQQGAASVAKTGTEVSA